MSSLHPLGGRGFPSRGHGHGDDGGARARAGEHACGHGPEPARGRGHGCARHRHACSRGAGWESRRCGCELWRDERARDRGHARGRGSGRERACGCCQRRGRVCGGARCCQRAGRFCRDERGSWCGRVRDRVSVSGRHRVLGRGSGRGRVCSCVRGQSLRPAGAVSSPSQQPVNHTR